MQVAIVKYNAGNVQSVQFALQRLGVDAIVTSDEGALRSADKIIFPGVGHANAAMQSLHENKLDRLIQTLTQPVLGICLGLQMMCSHSEEGDTDCLGIFDTPVKRFPAGSLKVPQVGWNSIENYASVLFNGLAAHAYVYAVHSYYAQVCRNTVATSDYILPFSAALQRDNFYAVQFHPEKSGDAGELILKNFIQLT